MNDPSCARWSRIVDSEALGEAPSKDDARFRREHEASCAACAGEAALWRSLPALGTLGTLGGQEPAAVAPELVERVLASSRAEAVQRDAAPSPVRRPWRRAGAIGAAGVLAVAAAVALVVRSTPPAPAPAAASARLLSIEGPVTIDDRPAAPGDEIRQGSTLRTAGGAACVRVGADARACLDRGGAIAFEATDGPARQLALVSGHLAVAIEHQPAGHAFSVATRAGTVRVVGTVFAVDGGDATTGAVTARVLEGAVSVSAPGAPEQRVTAHQAMVLGSAAAMPLSPDDEDRERLLLSGASPPPLPLAPTSAAPATSEAPLPPPPSATVEPPAPPRAETMLQRARELRASGRFRESADAYRALQAAHPRSAEARTALVSLGELQMAQLGDPAGALRSFESYLAGGGPLSQEAAYGKIRALRALGRAGDERRAIASFLGAYPASAQERWLRARLGELEGDAGP